MAVTRGASFPESYRRKLDLLERHLRADGLGWSAWMQIVVDAAVHALTQSGQLPKDAALEAALLHAHATHKLESARISEAEARALLQDKEALEERAAQERLTAPTAQYRSAAELVAAEYARLPPPGHERHQALTRLANQHGYPLSEIKREVGRRYSAERAGQTDLRVLPQPKGGDPK